MRLRMQVCVPCGPSVTAPDLQPVRMGAFLYNTAKKIADPLVKTFNQGDMMALMLEKS